MYKIFLFLFFSLLFVTNGKAQSSFTIDTTKVNLYIDSAKKVIYSDYDKAAYYIHRIDSISKKTNYKKGLYKSNFYFGILDYMRLNYRASISHYQLAHKYCNPADLKVLMAIYLNISMSYSKLLVQDSAVAYLDMAEKIALAIPNKKFLVRVLFLKGNNYLSKDNYVGAAKSLVQAGKNLNYVKDTMSLLIDYYTLALFYQKVDNFKRSYFYYKKCLKLDSHYKNFNQISAYYFGIGELFFRVKNNFDSAYYYYVKGMAFNTPIYGSSQELVFNNNVGNLYYDVDSINKAYYYYKKVLKDSMLNYYPEFKSAIYTNIGLYYYKIKDDSMALFFLQKGLKYSEKYGQLQFQLNALKVLAEEANKSNNFKKSMLYLQKYIAIDDSLQKNQAKIDIAKADYEKYEIEQRFQNDNLLNENALQEKKIYTQRIILVLLIVVAVLLVLFLVVLNHSRKKIHRLYKVLKYRNNQFREIIKKLEKSDKEVKALLKSKDSFVAILSHDLKNPFSGQLGLLQMMEFNWDDMDDKEKSEGVKLLLENARHTQQLLINLLDWSKTQQGIIIAINEKININKLVDEVIAIYTTNIEKKNIKVERDINDNSYIIADKNLSSQIIQNFMGNAIKYSYAGYTIKIVVQEDDNQTIISIEDSGIGIPSDKLACIFDIGCFINRPGTQNEKSSGMGLILCKEYATIMGARVMVESTEGEGSKFMLVITKKGAKA